MQTWHARCGDTRSRRPARSPSLPRSASAGARHRAHRRRGRAAHLRPAPRQSDRGAPRDPRGQGQERDHSRRSHAALARRGQRRDGTQVARVLRRVVVDTGPIVSVVLGDAAGAGGRVGAGRTRLRRHGGQRRRGSRRPDPRPPRTGRRRIGRAGRFLADVARPIPATRPLAERAALDSGAPLPPPRPRRLARGLLRIAPLPDAEVATSDTAIARVARAEGLDVIALPNPRGTQARSSRRS